jgi:membrane protein DedA with SNARE-associated domain
MGETLAVLVQWGYALLYAFVLADQLGLPIPAESVLLGVGALAGNGSMSLPVAVGVVVAAALPADLVWYELGRRRGPRVLARICAISLEPDWCVHRTESMFQRLGPPLLLIAKFIPGLAALASPVAGAAGVPRWQFILFDVSGALLWSGIWLGLGYVFSGALDVVAGWLARLGGYGLVLAGVALAAYIAYKYVERQRIFRELRMARITPEELKQRLDTGDASFAIIDTRTALDVKMVPFLIRGALWIQADEVERRRAELPRDREIVLYCT